MAVRVEDLLPGIRENGFNTDENVVIGGSLTTNGGIVRQAESVSASTKTITAAMAGRMFVDVQGTGTTTFTLPAAVAGLQYTFVCGHAGGEILINTASGDLIVGKTHGAENGTGIAPTTGTGIKNTAATNVIGDFCTLTALDTTTWYMTAVAGVWASQ